MEINYESVIGRKIDNLEFDDNVKKFYRGERILISGAGGSIGSKIVNLLKKFEDIKILAIDRDENSLHSLSLDILGTALFNSSDFKVVDIRDFTGLSNIFKEFKPTTVIHAAALKHLAILEKQPREAYLTNFLGTKNLLQISAKNGVKNFLNISTDKAANPKSVLGKTKHMTEILTSHQRHNGYGNYTNVRFGNVFNSKGSVIETFTRQLLSGLPVTLTDDKVERYFMKIEEAAFLSIISLSLNAGDIHLLDMGKPVRLKNIIEKIKLILQLESRIVLVGLREGEKMSEDLQGSNEAKVDTIHERISALNFNNSWEKSPWDFFEVNGDVEASNEIDRFLRIFHVF